MYSYNFNSYINNNDLLYKYQIKSINNLPKIKNFSISLSSIKILKYFLNYSVNQIVESDLQLNIFLLCCLLYSQAPFIYFSKKRKEFFFKIHSSSKTKNLDFLFYNFSDYFFFINEKLLEDNTKKLKISEFFLAKMKYNLIFFLRVPFIYISELDELFYKIFHFINTKDIFLTLSLKFSRT